MFEPSIPRRSNLFPTLAFCTLGFATDFLTKIDLDYQPNPQAFSPQPLIYHSSSARPFLRLMTIRPFYLHRHAFRAAVVTRLNYTYLHHVCPRFCGSLVTCISFVSLLSHGSTSHTPSLNSALGLIVTELPHLLRRYTPRPKSSLLTRRPRTPPRAG